jgi:hypothetical protein
MAAQDGGEPADGGGEHCLVGPVEAWCGGGSAQDGRFVAKHTRFDVLRGGPVADRLDQAEHLQQDQVQQS